VSAETPFPSVLLTGSGGFIGRVLAPLLAPLLTLDLADHLVDQGGCLALAGRKELDLCDRDAVLSLPPVKQIVHLAGASTTFAFDADPEGAWRTNFLSTLNLLEYARRHNIQHFVLASTYVYGPPQYLPVDEKHPIQPHHAYQRSKYLCEQLAEQYARDCGFKLSILRLFNVYGPGQDPRMLLPTLLAQLPTGQIHLRDASPRRDFVAVADVAEAFRLVLQTGAEGIFNLGSGHSLSVHELVSLVLRLYGHALPVSYSQSVRHHEVDDVVADTRRAQALLGWMPQISLESGLKELLCAS
jgi:GDP-4-dehydro-6-deoxy-D-mannose reductase